MRKNESFHSFESTMISLENNIEKSTDVQDENSNSNSKLFGYFSIGTLFLCDAVVNIVWQQNIDIKLKTYAFSVENVYFVSSIFNLMVCTGYSFYQKIWKQTWNALKSLEIKIWIYFGFLRALHKIANTINSFALQYIDQGFVSMMNYSRITMIILLRCVVYKRIPRSSQVMTILAILFLCVIYYFADIFICQFSRITTIENMDWFINFDFHFISQSYSNDCKSTQKDNRHSFGILLFFVRILLRSIADVFTELILHNQLKKYTILDHNIFAFICDTFITCFILLFSPFIHFKASQPLEFYYAPFYNWSWLTILLLPIQFGCIVAGISNANYFSNPSEINTITGYAALWMNILLDYILFQPFKLLLFLLNTVFVIINLDYQLSNEAGKK